VTEGRRHAARPAGLPAGREALLLDAALLEPSAALDRWHRWQELANLEHDLTPGERRLLPTVYDHLVRAGQAEAAGFDARVVGICKRTFYYNSLLFRNLSRVLGIFDRGGIRPLLTKGAALLLSGAYPTISARVLADFDLLVPFEQKQAAFDLLSTQGFEPLPRWSWYLEPFQQVHSISLTSGELGEIDLHWYPLATHKCPQDNAHFFAARQALHWEDREVGVPEPELQMVHAMAHGLQNDAAGRTQWVCDAVRLTRAFPGLDWERVASHAAALEAGAFVQVGSEYLGRRFAGCIPDTALAAIRAIEVSADERRVFTAVNRPQTTMRDQLYLMKRDLERHRPGRARAWYWRTLWRYWRHAAAASGQHSLLRELAFAARQFVRNRRYDMGDYRENRDRKRA
jgi:Uncharacterised nucleotidyltransferase